MRRGNVRHGYLRHGYVACDACGDVGRDVARIVRAT